MKIGELSDRAAVSVRALRYYEEQGLLRSRRSGGGQRLYVESDVRRVKLMQALYSVGIHSRAIADIVPYVDQPTAQLSQRAWSRIRHRREQVVTEIEGLTAARDALDNALARHSRRERNEKVIGWSAEAPCSAKDFDLEPEFIEEGN